MTVPIVLAVLAILAAAFTNALSVIASNGVKSELKSLRELMDAKHDALEQRVQQCERFKDDFFKNKLSKGATQC